MKIHNFEQNTQEWIDVRIGKITASGAHNLLVKGAGKTRKSYILSKACEIVTGVLQGPDLSGNPWVERGKELEALAIQRYEEETFSIVERVGFVELSQYVGCSPDGIVSPDGLIEVKCKKADNHLQSIIDGKEGIENNYYTQMQMQMFCCDAQWCDYVLFHPDFPANHDKYRDLHIIRIERDDIFIKNLEKEIEKAIVEIRTITE